MHNKLRVSFRKRATNYRALLRKMTHKDETFRDSLCLRVIGCLFVESWNVFSQKSHELQGSFAENNL